MKNLKRFYIIHIIALLCVLPATSSEKQTDTKNISKSDHIAQDFYNEPNLTRAKKKIGQNLERISGICKMQTLDQKINTLNKTFRNLRKTCKVLLKKQNLSVKDHVFLSNISEGIDPRNIFFGSKNITPQLVKNKNLAQSFLDHYAVQHGLPDDIDLQNDLDWWAMQIFKGLNCLYTQK